MPPFSKPITVVIKSNPKDTSSRLISRVGSEGLSYDVDSLDLCGDVVLSGDPPGNMDESIGGVAKGKSLVKRSVGNSNQSNGSVSKAKGSVKGSIVKSDSFSRDLLSDIHDNYQQQYQQGNKEIVAGPTIQDPSLQYDYQQQYQHGNLVLGFPQGMTPTQQGMVPPDMMPPPVYMMQPYYNCAPYYDYYRGHPDKQTVDFWSVEGINDPIGPSRNSGGELSCAYSALYSGRCYDYSGGHRDMPTKDEWSSSRNDDTYSSNSSGSSCATLMCAEPFELTKLVGRVVDSWRGGKSNDVGSDKSSSTHATISPEDHDELLEKVDKLYKLVTEKDASGDAIKQTTDMVPLAVVNESANTQHAGNELIGADLFRQNSARAEDNARHSSSTHATLSTPEDYAELGDKIDKPCKLVAEKEASSESEKKSTNMISLEASTCFNLVTEDQFIEIEDDCKDSKISEDHKIGEDRSIKESSFTVKLTSIEDAIEAEVDSNLSMVDRTDHRDDILDSDKDPYANSSNSLIEESLEKNTTFDENESVAFPDDEKMHHQDGKSNHSTTSSSSCIRIVQWSEDVDKTLWDHDDRQRDLYCTKPGGVENLVVRQYSNLPTPNAPDHLLVKVEVRSFVQLFSATLRQLLFMTTLPKFSHFVQASTVSSSDCIVRARFSFIPGFQVVGQVCALGTMIDPLKIRLGDRVAALLPKGGGNAKYISIPVSWAILLPKSASHDDIICLVANYMTAYQCLKLAKKDGVPLTNANVLITGGSGPVGQALIELAFQDGANVYATAHEMHQEYLTELGAQWLCLEPQQWLPELEGKMDVVIDLLKIDGYKSSYHALRRDGVLICNVDKVSEIQNNMSWWDTVKAKFFWNPPIMYELFGSFRNNPAVFAHELSYLTWKLQRGEIRPKVAGRVTLNQVPLAQQLIDEGLPSKFSSSRDLSQTIQMALTHAQYSQLYLSLSTQMVHWYAIRGRFSTRTKK